MPAPESTSVGNLPSYIGGKILAVGKGEAWRDIKAMLALSSPVGELLNVPSVSEPFLTWVATPCKVEIHDREKGGPWVKSIVKKGSFFLTTGGAPYDCRWKSLTSEPCELMYVLLNLPLMKRAYEEVYGIEAKHARPRDVSGGEDDQLNALMEQLRDELMRRTASKLFVTGITQALAILLVRKYSALTQQAGTTHSPSLPGFKLRQITDWMAQNATEEFSLAKLSEMAGLSKFHFHRLFKKTTGVTPTKYHLGLRVNMAQQMLRETKKSVVDIAVELGYTNPSHFAKIFRRETGLSPRDYRLQR